VKGKASFRSIRAIFLFLFPLFLLLFSGSSPFTTPAFAENVLYFTEPGKIRRAAIDGSGTVVDVVTSGISTPFGITVDTQAEKIYWTDNTDLNIRKANLDGTNIEEIITSGLVNPLGMDIDIANGRIYWAEFSDDTIHRADLDGGNPVTLTDVQARVRDVALQVIGGVDDGKIYYTTRSPLLTLQRRNHDATGSNPEDIVTGLVQARGIDLDLTNGKVYWASSDGGTTTPDRIFRADLSPGSTAELFIDLGTDATNRVLEGVALDLGTGLSDSFVYFADSNGAIHRASLDGLTTELNFITGLNSPRHLEIGPAPPIPELPPGAFPMLAFSMSGLVLWLRRRISP